MKPVFFRNLLVVLLSVGTFARADLLQLKNGEVLNGRYTGGGASNVLFATNAGQYNIDTAQIGTLTFTPPPPPPPPPAPAAFGPVTLPTGTVLLVRMMDTVSSRNAPGANFTTKLEYNLVANGVVVVPAGTIIYGKVQSSSQARRARGHSSLDIRLSQMVVNGSAVSVATSSYAQATEDSINRTAKAAAAGAIIGNNTGSGSAWGGAAIGVGVAMLKPGQTLTLSPGTLLEFTLTQPASVQVGR